MPLEPPPIVDLQNCCNSDVDASSVTVVLVGASVRAAAASICRQKRPIELIGIDQFGDEDTRQMCDHWIPLQRPYFDHLVRTKPNHRFQIYRVGGGVDRCVDHLVRHLNRSGYQLDLCDCHIDPTIEQLLDWSNDLMLRIPETRLRKPVKLGGDWIRKPREHCGGLGIEVVGRSSDQQPGIEGQFYWQRLIRGQSYGVVYRRNGDVGERIGICRSTVTSIKKQPFVYAGSVGPIESPWPSKWDEMLKSLSNRVLRQSPNTRLINIDVIFDGRIVWILEVNARYSASMEIHELARGDSLLDGTDSMTKTATQPTPAKFIFQKRILFAQQRMVFDRGTLSRKYPNAAIADYPRDGSVIEATHPVCTLIHQRPMKSRSKRSITT